MFDPSAKLSTTPSGNPGIGPMAGCDRALAEQRWNDGQLLSPVDSPRIRLWRHRCAAIVLGRAQHALAGEHAASASIPLVTRQAGGGAVLVGPWLLSLSIALPPAHHLVAGRSIAASYDWIAGAFVSALALQGVQARAATADDACKAPPTLDWACFAGITAGEVLVDRRKLVGFAQRRSRHGVLIVAGLLVDTVPWRMLRDGMPGMIDANEADRQARALATATIDLGSAGVDPAALALESVIDRFVQRLVAEVGEAIDHGGSALVAEPDQGAARALDRTVYP